MAESVIQLQAIDSAGRGLRVDFQRRGDRWRHEIAMVEGHSSRLVLESTEGDAVADWPISPPFQELSQETLPDGRTVIFLVGKAGTSHWSASVETQHDPPRLVFDIACRHAQEPAILKSSYSVSDAGACMVRGLDSLAVVEGGATLLEVTPATIAAPLPGTTRWKYAVTVT